MNLLRLGFPAAAFCSDHAGVHDDFRPALDVDALEGRRTGRGATRTTMYDSPRMRRLRNDLAALERLQTESSVFRFRAKSAQHFFIRFLGKSLWRSSSGEVKEHKDHHVEIKLGASYPRMIPEIRWMTSIYHPNISAIGMVCLGGYGTHWVPSVQLDELCNMLWDMARYQNYDIRSAYNADAALWVATQTSFVFPMDPRPLRDLRA